MQAGTREGNHQRHTHTINASPPSKANNATLATKGNPPARLYTHLNNTPHTHHTAPYTTEAPATYERRQGCGAATEEHPAVSVTLPENCGE